MKKKFVVPAVVLGSGKSGLGITRNLGRNGVPVEVVYYNKKDFGHASKYCDNALISPHPGEHEHDFVKWLLENKAGQTRKILFPSDDAGFNAIIKNRELLSDHFILPQNSTNKLSTALNKDSLYTAAEIAGIPVPRIFVPEDFDQADWFARETGFPVIMRTAGGDSLKSVFRTDKILLESSSHLKNYSAIAWNFGKKVILEEYIPGEGDSTFRYSSLFIKTKPVLEFASVKRNNSDFWQGENGIWISRYTPGLFSPAKKILNAIDYQGFSTIEFKKDSRSGVYKILKLIPRLNNSLILAAECGVNFPFQMYLYGITGVVPEEKSYFRENVWLVDHGFKLPVDINNSRRIKKIIDLVVTPYTKKKIFPVASWIDPMPLVKSVTNKFRYLPETVAAAIKNRSVKRKSMMMKHNYRNVS